jgi:hypothetical protein
MKIRGVTGLAHAQSYAQPPAAPGFPVGRHHIAFLVIYCFIKQHVDLSPPLYIYFPIIVIIS